MSYGLAAWVFVCGCVTGWFVHVLYDGVKRRLSS